MLTNEPKRTRKPNGASSIYKGKDGRWHGRVTVGVKDDGTPDSRHVERKTEAEVIKAVRELERQRDKGKVRKAGRPWTLKAWLLHWIETIAKPSVSENSYDGYEVAVRVHLVPGLGAHRLDRLEPEHLERFYAKMQANGSKPATAHQAHRTVRTALGEAVRRGTHHGQPRRDRQGSGSRKRRSSPTRLRRRNGCSSKLPRQRTVPVG